jgi:hypothetical protein
MYGDDLGLNSGCNPVELKRHQAILRNTCVSADRVKQYQQMVTVAALLKDYASSQYGNKSQEYKSLTAPGI